MTSLLLLSDHWKPNPQIKWGQQYSFYQHFCYQLFIYIYRKEVSSFHHSMSFNSIFLSPVSWGFFLQISTLYLFHNMSHDCYLAEAFYSDWLGVLIVQAWAKVNQNQSKVNPCEQISGRYCVILNYIIVWYKNNKKIIIIILGMKWNAKMNMYVFS